MWVCTQAGKHLGRILLSHFIKSFHANNHYLRISVNNFVYPKFNFQYPKIRWISDIRKWISDIRKWISDIREWILDIRNWFSDIHKWILDIRNSAYFLISVNEFRISEIPLIFGYRKIASCLHLLESSIKSSPTSCLDIFWRWMVVLTFIEVNDNFKG